MLAVKAGPVYFILDAAGTSVNGLTSQRSDYKVSALFLGFVSLGIFSYESFKKGFDL